MHHVVQALSTIQIQNFSPSQTESYIHDIIFLSPLRFCPILHCLAFCLLASFERVGYHLMCLGGLFWLVFVVWEDASLLFLRIPLFGIWFPSFLAMHFYAKFIFFVKVWLRIEFLMWWNSNFHLSFLHLFFPPVLSLSILPLLSSFSSSSSS